MSPKLCWSVCLLCVACGGAQRADTIYAQPAAPSSPAAILDCDERSAPLHYWQGAHTACNLWLTHSCDTQTALYYGVINEEVCSRVADARQYAHNMDLITRAMFWRDTGCALDGSSAAHDDLLSEIMPVEPDKQTRAVVSGCGQERRYLCRRPFVSAIYPVRPTCEPLPAADALAAAFSDARALMAAQTGCLDATLSNTSGGTRPDLGVTEVILEGCGQRFPVVCELTPELRHAAACEHQPPLPEALAHSRDEAARLYASAAACPADVAPTLTARPVEHLERGAWQLVWDASGCSGAAQLRCVAHRLRARQMSCSLPPQPTQEQLGAAALIAARRLRPGCTFERAWRGGDALGLRSRQLAEGRCGEQELKLPLLCEYEPLVDRLRCDLDAAREALVTASRDAARAAFAAEYSCAPAKISVVSESEQGDARRLELVGCKERASYVCAAGADGPPRCAP